MLLHGFFTVFIFTSISGEKQCGGISSISSSWKWAALVYNANTALSFSHTTLDADAFSLIKKGETLPSKCGETADRWTFQDDTRTLTVQQIAHRQPQTNQFSEDVAPATSLHPTGLHTVHALYLLWRRLIIFEFHQCFLFASGGIAMVNF